MADLNLTMAQLTSLFWSVTMQMLGYDPADYTDPDKPPASMPVRKSWPSTGAPAWQRLDDVVFLRVYEDDDEINKQIDTVYIYQDANNAEEQTGQTRVLRVQWTCYGPNSYENARKIRRLLFADKYREALSANEIYLIPAVRAPVRAPEPYAGQWWERTDLAAQFNSLIRISETVPFIKSAEISVASKDGESSADVPPQNE